MTRCIQSSFSMQISIKGSEWCRCVRDAGGAKDVRGAGHAGGLRGAGV